MCGAARHSGPDEIGTAFHGGHGNGTAPDRGADNKRFARVVSNNVEGSGYRFDTNGFGLVVVRRTDQPMVSKVVWPS
jgi:hypothetical protein